MTFRCLLIYGNGNVVRLDDTYGDSVVHDGKTFESAGLARSEWPDGETYREGTITRVFLEKLPPKPRTLKDYVYRESKILAAIRRST